MDSDELLEDYDGDWFIDIPAGSVLELPTGEVGDEGLFELWTYDWPFADEQHPDYLNYTEDSSSWRYDLIPKHMLDPLVGVEPMSDPADYPSLVDPNYVHVSPISDSDISDLGTIGGVPAVNALGERRGLIAFRIIGIGDDPDGPGGSQLPNIIIEVVDPTSVNIQGVNVHGLESGGGGAQLVG